jgi:hypothetical protein
MISKVLKLSEEDVRDWGRWIMIFWMMKRIIWKDNLVAITVEASRVESSATKDGQSASLSWNKAPIWGLRLDFYYCQTVAGLLVWGALSDKRTGLSFTTAAGLRQRTHSRVRVPWGSRPYSTLRFETSFLSPHTTRRATVEVFDPASTRD